MALSAARTKVLAMLTVCVVCPTVHAQADSITDYLRRMDQNRDGRVSANEYVAWMSYGFEAMDRNRDGVLQSLEQPGGRGKPLTRAEHHANLVERFRKQDVDRNGFLSVKELAAPPR